MRGNPNAHEMIALASLPDVLELLAAAPGKWTATDAAATLPTLQPPVSIALPFSVALA